MALKNFSQAQTVYEKALELHPNHPVRITHILFYRSVKLVIKYLVKANVQYVIVSIANVMLFLGSIHSERLASR